MILSNTKRLPACSGITLSVWKEQLIGGLSRHLHKQSSIKLHTKLKPPFCEQNKKNLEGSEKL